MFSWDLLFFAGVVFFGFVGLLYVECLVSSIRARTDMLIALGDKLDRNYRQLEGLDISTPTMIYEVEAAEEDCRQMFLDLENSNGLYDRKAGGYNGTRKSDNT